MTYPHLELAADPHDRAGLRRNDEAWLAGRWADPETRVLVISGTRVRPRDGAIDWLSPSAAPEGDRVLLGERDGRTWFAVVVPPEAAKAAPDQWFPLRGLLPFLGGVSVRLAPLVFHALGLAEWLWVTKFCPRCGGALEVRASGHELKCVACGRSQFPRSDPAVIMVVAHGEPGSDEERCLLGRQSVWPAGRFSTLAGFCEPGETLEDAVRREVDEEVGVPVGEVTYFGNQPWPLPASLMVGFVARAESKEIHVDGAEIEQARWFTRDELREAVATGEVTIPRSVSISSSLLAHWYGEPLPGGGW